MLTPHRNPHKLAERLALVAPEILARFFTPDCCIAASRIALAVLARYGVAAAPAPCEVIILNPAYRARCNAGRPCQDHLGMIEAFAEDGSWAVGIGSGEPTSPGPRPGYNGHLCVTLARSGAADDPHDLLLDLTLGQASRPDRKISLKPIVFAAGPQFWEGKSYSFTDVNGSAVGYRRKSATGHMLGARREYGADAYQTSPDWLGAWGRLEAPIDLMTRACR